MHTWAVAAASPGRALPTSVLDALDDADQRCLTFPASDHFRWASRAGAVAAAGWAHVAASEIGSFWEIRDDGLTAFSGRVWLDQTPWAAHRSWAAQLADAVADIDVVGAAGRFTGQFALVHLRADGSGWITADPLGVAMIYRAEGAEYTVFSNRAELAASLVTPPGRRPARDVVGAAHFAFTGSYHDGHTGFDAVRVIPQASVVHVSADAPPRIDTWSIRPWWTGETDVEPADATARSLDRLRAALRLLVNAGDERTVCELTGGKDSRLVLALLLAEGLATEVEFRTWGSPDLPDVQIASQLTERYGLDHRCGAGPLVNRTGWGHGGGTGRRERSSFAARTLDVEAQYRHHVWATSGAVSVWDLHTPLWPPSGAVSLCGIGVEILSTNYAATDRVDRPELLARFVERGGFVYDSAGLLTTEAARSMRASLVQEILEAGLGDGSDPRDAIDGYYVRGKFRRWSGALAEIDVRERVFAGYDLAVIGDAFALGARARRSDVLHHRLMEACAPGLAGHRFSGGGWSPDLLRHVPEATGVPLRSGGRRWVPPAVEVEGYRVRRALHRTSNPLLSTLARRRRMAGGRAAEASRMADLATKKAALRSLLDVPAGHATWDLYDRGRTLAALDRLEQLPSPARAEVHHAATVAAWLGEGERRADVFASQRG